MRGSGGARQGQNKLAPHCHDLAGRHDVADHQPFTWRRFIDGYDAAVRERVWKGKRIRSSQCSRVARCIPVSRRHPRDDCTSVGWRWAIGVDTWNAEKQCERAVRLIKRYCGSDEDTDSRDKLGWRGRAGVGAEHKG